MEPKKYIFLKAYDIIELEDQVNEKAKKGYIVDGNLIYEESVYYILMKKK